MADVSVGLTTKAGYAAAGVAFAAAFIAYVGSDGSEQTLGTVVAGAISALSLLATQTGRYAQAKEAIKHPLGAADLSGVATPALPAAHDAEIEGDEYDVGDVEPANEKRDLHDSGQA